MQVPFLSFPITWGEAIMVLGLGYWLFRDGVKALWSVFVTHRLRGVMKEVLRHNGNNGANGNGRKNGK